MLVLQGLRWLQQGHDVHIISADPACLAASIMMRRQLQKTLRADSTASPTPGTVRLHQYHLAMEPDLFRVVSDLLSLVRGGTLCVLMDETGNAGR